MHMCVLMRSLYKLAYLSRVYHCYSGRFLLPNKIQLLSVASLGFSQDAIPQEKSTKRSNYLSVYL